MKIPFLNRRSWPGLLLIFGVLILIPQFLNQLYSLGVSAARDLPRLLTTTEEDRRLEVYGDKTIMGYGYLKKILDGIPDPYFFPLVRYSYYGMNVNVVLPGNRNAVDKRLLVGIDLLPSDVTENIVSKTKNISRHQTAASAVSGWGFITQWEYDLLTGVIVRFKEPLPSQQSFKAVMLNSPSDPSRAGEWNWPNIPLQNPLKLTFDPPMKDIYGRGSLPFGFMLENRGASPDQTAVVTGVDILGVKVNIQGYLMIHEEGRCFTAIENSFYHEVLEQGPQEWRDYLAKITNIPAVSKALAAASVKEK